MQQDGGRGRIVHLAGPDDAAGLSRVVAAIENLRVLGRLRRSRIGLAASFSAGAAATLEPENAGLRQASTVFGALSDLMARERLDAVAVRCFDLVTGRGTSGCLALPALNDAGLVAACEGDLASTVGMLWVKELLGTASWMANPSHADAATGLLLLVPGHHAARLRDYWEWAVADPDGRSRAH